MKFDKPFDLVGGTAMRPEKTFCPEDRNPAIDEQLLLILVGLKRRLHHRKSNSNCESTEI